MQAAHGGAFMEMTLKGAAGWGVPELNEHEGIADDVPQLAADAASDERQHAQGAMRGARNRRAHSNAKAPSNERNESNTSFARSRCLYNK